MKAKQVEALLNWSISPAAAPTDAGESFLK
jgi:hypothetical protein